MVTKNSKNNTDEFDFEKKLTELERIVKALEEGSLSLDDSLKQFEKGVELYNLCKGKLKAAEKKIKVLTENLEEVDY